MTEQARITVTPESALIDVPREIRIDGFPAYAFVTVTARMRMCAVPWRSQAVFMAGHDGSLDLARDCPVSGSYAEPSAMGLVWSMTCEEMERVVFPPDRAEPLVIDLHATDGRHEATARLAQTFVAEGVTHRAVREQVGGMTLSGELYTPAGPGPHPLVIYMNGSSGGVNAPRAALFAARGRCV